MVNRRVGENVKFQILVKQDVKMSKKLDTGFSLLDGFLEYMKRAFVRETPSYAGWKPCNRDGGYRSLMVRRLEKDDNTVYFLNTSPMDPQDSPPAYVDATFFSDQRYSLELLCGDWGFDKTGIKENISVQQFVEKIGYGPRDFDA